MKSLAAALATVLLASFAIAGCGDGGPHAQGAAKAPSPVGLVTPGKAVKISGMVTAQLIGGRATGPRYVMLGAAMATSRTGWAWAEGSPAPERTYGLVTSDGGVHFKVAFGAPDRIVDVSAPDPQHAYFLESSCLAGCTTQLQELAQGASAPRTIWHADRVAADSLSFPTAQVGYVAATVRAYEMQGKPRVLVTHDGGETFSALPSPCPEQPHADAISFVNPKRDWLLCGAGNIEGPQAKNLYATRDGGQNWTLVASSTHGALPAGGSIVSLSFTSVRRGFIGLDGNGVLATADGGRTWTRAFTTQVPRGEGRSAAVGFLPNGHGWLVRSAPQPFEVTADGGRTWQLGDRGPTQVQLAADLGDGRALAYAESAGSPPQLLATQNGGASWYTVSWPPFHAGALQALSPRAIMAAGGGGVEISRDGGETWSV